MIGKNCQSPARGYTVNFIKIKPDWLKQAVKHFLWSQIPRRETGTLIRYSSNMKVISSFMEEHNILYPEQINREFIVDLINYISPNRKAKTVGNYLSVFKDFFDFCQENEMISRTQGKLIFDDDYPKKTKSQVKDIPDYILKRLKEVWDSTHFNMEGEIVAPVNPDLDTAEMQWIKKGMGMQTTDGGYCTLLWTQTCPHQDLPCKGCGSWVTTLDFLDSHKKELEETEKIIENARQKGYQRQIEKNVPRAERLRKIISAMEQHQTMRGIGHNEWEKNK